MKIIDYDVDSNNNLSQSAMDIDINIIGSVGIGYNAPKIAEINGIKGFLKESGNTSPTFDKFEYLISKLGKYIGVKTADEYLVETDGKLSVFSRSVVADDETLIMASKLYQELYNTGKASREMLEQEKQEISEFNNGLEVIPAANHSEMKIDSDQIEYALNTFINKVKMLKIPNEEEIIKDYIKMCFLDAVIGNKDRNTNNFGLIKRKDGTYSFAPLFDSSTIAMPGIDNDYCHINDYLIDRKELLHYILNTYPNYLEDIFDSDIDKVGEKMTIMSSQILDDGEYTWFNSTVLNKLNRNIFDTIKNQKF